MQATAILPFLLAGLATTAWAAPIPGAGMAMRAEPKYPPGFKAFDYANPDAPKGGALVIGLPGSVDSMNPHAAKGLSSLYIDTLVFQQLGDESYDEPFTRYPAVAEGFELAADRLSMVVTLRKEAKFSDGKAITADDVVFSFQIFKTDKVPPLYKFYWADIKEVVATDQHTVKFVFAKENPELALIATQLPVLPKHFYGQGDFATDFATKALGSGPYIIKDFKAGSHFVLKRNPDFWGKDLSLYRGRYNFDEITVKYFKDSTAEVEAFKKGDFDVFDVHSSKAWAMDLSGERFETLKWIKKELWANHNNQGGQGYLFNLRKPIFQDIRVRKAIALAFDFEWSNKNIFYGQYRENASFFENSPLKATGLPPPPELAVLEPLKADLPPEVFTKEMGYLGRGKDIKERLREAMGLLKEAGYAMKEGVAVGAAGKLEFKFLSDSPTDQRIVEPYSQNLKKLGVQVAIEEKERSIYIKRVDSREFDMIGQAIGQSPSPGNEQLDLWSSAAADQNQSSNVAGIKNKAIDTLIDKIIYAKTRAELELYTRCLDRALYHLHLMVHNWHMTAHRVAIWDKFGRPGKLPDYYYPRNLFEFMWLDADRAKRLTEAKDKGAPLL